MEDGSPLPVDEEGFPVKETFHVDTHRLCFVCLEDIPVPLSPRQLNSEVASGSKSLRTADKAKIINLNRLLHYLKIDRESISDCVNNSLRTEAGDVVFPEGADFSALTCENCSHVYDQLVELYEEMEMIKMQLHDSLDVFCEKLMNSAEKVPKLIKSDSSGEELSSPAGLDLVHAVAAEVIRNKAIEKCTFLTFLFVLCSKSVESKLTIFFCKYSRFGVVTAGRLCRKYNHDSKSRGSPCWFDSTISRGYNDFDISV